MAQGGARAAAAARPQLQPPNATTTMHPTFCHRVLGQEPFAFPRSCLPPSQPPRLLPSQHHMRGPQRVPLAPRWPHHEPPVSDRHTPTSKCKHSTTKPRPLVVNIFTHPTMCHRIREWQPLAFPRPRPPAPQPPRLLPPQHHQRRPQGVPLPSQMAPQGSGFPSAG